MSTVELLQPASPYQTGDLALVSRGGSPAMIALGSSSTLPAEAFQPALDVVKQVGAAVNLDAGMNGTIQHFTAPAPVLTIRPHATHAIPENFAMTVGLADGPVVVTAQAGVAINGTLGASVVLTGIAKLYRVDENEFFTSDVGTEGAPGLLFVSPSGSDAQIGDSMFSPLRTISEAFSRAASVPAHACIWALPGSYLSDCEEDMPDNTSFLGPMSARSANVSPTPGNEEKNLFRMGSGCYIANIQVTGLRVNDFEDPRSGFAYSFRPGAVIYRAPYVHNCTVYRSSFPTNAPAPPDPLNGNPLVGRGPGVILADGDVVSKFSPVPNIMAWGVTPATPNGMGYVARGPAFINAVNAIALYCHKAYVTLDGGQMTLSACSTQLGDFSCWSQGSRSYVEPTTTTGPTTVDSAAATIVDDNTDAMINEVWQDLVDNGYTIGWTLGNTPGTDEYFTRRDTSLLVKSIYYAFLSGMTRPVERFAGGMFDLNGNPVFSPDKRTAFIRAFNYLKSRIVARGISAAATTMLDNMIAALVSTVNDPILRRQPSLLTAIDTQISYPRQGVTLDALPPSFRGIGTLNAQMESAIIELDGGKVTFSGKDDAGNALFAGGLKIDASSGELRGPPFERAVENKAIEAAIAASF